MTTGAPPVRNRVFISYSRKDREWVARVREHLRPLERDPGLGVDVWDDSEIEAGADWMEEIRGAVASARAVVLLVSAAFLASDFIESNELPPLLDAANKEGVRILPVHVKPSRYVKTEGLRHFQSVNDPARPLINLPEGEQEQVLLNLADAVERAFAQAPPATKPAPAPPETKNADAIRQLPLVSSALEELRQELRDRLGDDETIYEPAALVAESVLLGGLRAVARRAHPKRLAKLISASLAAAANQLRHANRPLETAELKSQFIRYAAGDDDLAQLVGIVLMRREDDAPVLVELGGAEDDWGDVKGLRLRGGFIGPDFVPADGPREVVLEDVTIHGTADTVSNVEELAPLIRKLFHENQPGTTPRHSLLIIAAGLDGRALQMVLDERAAGRNITAARCPDPGTHWKALLTDFTFISIGRADKVIVNEHETYIMVSQPSPTMYKVLLASLRKQLGETTEAHKRDELTARLNTLERGVAITRVGGKTDEERRRRAGRARRVVRHYEEALSYGVVAGEYLALANAAAAVCAREADEEQKQADVIVSDALETPLRRMAEDWGRDGAETLRAVRARQLETGNNNVGYYSEGDSFVDLFEVGAVVPFGNVVKVMMNAVDAARQRVAEFRYTDEIVQEVAALEGR